MRGRLLIALKALSLAPFRLLRSRKGNLSVVTALILPSMVGVIGMAVDISHALSIRSELEVAADAAVLSAVTDDAVQTLTQGTGISEAGLKKLALGTERMFLDNIPEALRVSISVAPDVTVTYDKDHIIASLQFRAEMKTDFVRMIGVKQVPISGIATSMANMPRFMDIHFLLDNSPSMGIAATPDDALKLSEIVKRYAIDTNKTFGRQGCVFACHDTFTSFAFLPLDMEERLSQNYYPLARAANITLRIDMVRDAVSQLLHYIDDNKFGPHGFRYSLYDLGQDETTVNTRPLRPLLRNETNLSRTIEAVQSLDLMITPYGGFNSSIATPLPQALDELRTTIPMGGTGLTNGSPQQVLIIISDGQANSQRPTGCATPLFSDDQCNEPVDVSLCNEIKRRGIRIAALSLSYLAMPDIKAYRQFVAPIADQLEPAMEACASPGLHSVVKYGDPIDKPLQDLFRKLVDTPRLSM